MSKYDNPEYAVARQELLHELRVPERLLWTIKDLIGCSLVRIFFAEAIRQDAVDPVWLQTIDEHGGEEWRRIDGWPDLGGDIVRRKWAHRAQFWTMRHSASVTHVIDWLSVARSEGHAWLGSLDGTGYPKKLMKCGSIERLVHEADKGLRTRKVADVTLGPEDEAFTADLGAGHTLVELLSPVALRKEGSILRHCIGHGGYDWLLADPARHLYGVRNQNGEPLATLEVHGSAVRQFRGPKNEDPSPAVIDLVADVAFRWGWLGLEEAARGGSYGPEALVILRDLPPARRRP
ncbi:PcfJ domain-containing protein [Ensifer sp. 2YAB10]|uniref:PcfJ domain-containing protein n=1 Tax=unclassified Ensifer TaxID=2633371 RepID=UPI003F8F0461